jgi:hypothetical protein
VENKNLLCDAFSINVKLKRSLCVTKLLERTGGKA